MGAKFYDTAVINHSCMMVLVLGGSQNGVSDLPVLLSAFSSGLGISGVSSYGCRKGEARQRVCVHPERYVADRRPALVCLLLYVETLWILFASF